MIRSIDGVDEGGILVVNYVNSRSIRRPIEERELLDELAAGPMNLSVSEKDLRRQLDKLHRFGIVTVRSD